ncbi:MAG: hypothetical protein V1787_05445 [Candidatus Micrarchaeota archaeon]
MDEFLYGQLKRLRKACTKADIAELKDFGEDVAEKAFLANRPEMLNLAVVAYSIAKFEEKPYIVKGKQWPAQYKKILEQLDEYMRAAKDEQEEECYEMLAEMVEEFEEFSYASSRFRSTVVEKARIKAATQVYAHGASLSVAAEFAGVPKEELAKYIGVTKLPEKYETYSVKERLQTARELFS